jgi:large conductance mechanosensitive channel
MTRRTRSFLADFRDFILRGNVIDLAVAVIIGGAFGKIVESLVADIITPVILNPALQAANVDKLSELSANGVQYGLFLAAVINFLVISFCIFLIIRSFESAQRRMVRQEEAAAAEEPVDQTVVAQERLTAAVERLAVIMEQQK